MLKHAGSELVVAHFLGVDHVGHTFGPNSEQMKVKLRQMDDVLSDIINTVDDEVSGSVEDDDTSSSCTALFVFGDHGMTEGGNHGGGTEEETGAALFSHFSPSCVLPPPESRVTGEELASASTVFNSVNQVDLVPTISYLLGLPVPFANIGSVITSLIPMGKDGAEVVGVQGE